MTDTNHHVLTGKVDITSNLLVGSSHLFVDTNNNRVGLVTTNPDAGLHVNSNAYVNTDLRVGSQIEINATAGRVKAASFEGDGSLLQNTPPGADGAAATIAVGTTGTGAAGTSASVTNSGTNSTAVFDFVIPRGDQGIQGNPGNDGADGADGANGADGVNGADGANGANGADGTNYFTLSGSNIYRSTGNVGINTSSPDETLDILGSMRIGNGDGMLTINERTNSGFDGTARNETIALQTTIDGRTLAQGAVYGHEPRVALALQPDFGYVGIGKVDPKTRLHIINVDSNSGAGDAYISGRTYKPSECLRLTGQWRGTGSGALLKFTNTHGGGTNPNTGEYNTAGIAGFDYSNQWGGGLVFYTSPNTSGGGNLTERMVISNSGNVGIGTTTPYAKLHVNGGSGAIATGWRKYFKWNDPNHGGGSLAGQSGHGWGAHSIYANYAIVCGHYFVSAQGAITSSDERIKKDIVDVEDGKALDIIRELKPKKYRYKDEINRGVEPVWGFIAQEVNDILPEAVKIDEECIPNIYEMANVSTSNVITFTNFDTSTLESNASVLKVFDEDNNEHLLTIDKVIDEHSIRVKEDRTESQLFIYGQRVNDFHRIRKETVWTVATAALQEVDRQLQTTRTELSDTKEELQSEKKKTATMELLVASLVKRVGDLENLVI